jgi:(p)ppGpp synthase/HD superfamily hydrolase
MMLLGERFCEALPWAARLHADQLRKVSGTPYVAHLLRVAGIVLDHGGGEDEAIAALLHDAIEDQGGAPTGVEIGRRFGPRVLEIVAACTDADQVPKPPWRTRKEAYIERLRSAPAAVRLVSAADKLDNARSLVADYRRLGESLWQHFRGGRDGTLWYYRSVIEALKPAGGPLVDELALVVAELEELARSR